VTTILWKGYTWEIDDYTGSPGPNVFDPSNVFVDGDGFLHLQINRVNNVWTCAQIETVQNLGYGTYRCVVKGRLDQLDLNAIWSMFNYNGPDFSHEIDIEIAYWGDAGYGPIGYTAYPDTVGAYVFNRPFPMVQTSDETTHTFIWKPDGVEFFAQQGVKAAGDLTDIIAAAHSDVTSHGDMPIIFIMWLMSGLAPVSGLPQEMIIEDFTFTAYSAPATKKIAIIRDDGVIDDTAALEGFLTILHDRGVKGTLSVIPHQITQDGIDYLNHFAARPEPAWFELATCGYDADGVEDPVAVQPEAKALMIANFGKIPNSIVPPQSNAPAGFMAEALSLGYHSMINAFNFAPPRTLYAFPFNFLWEADWGSAPNWIVTYDTFANFKTQFDWWYAHGSNYAYEGANPQVFSIDINHKPLYNDNNPTAAQARIDFADSLNYMIAKGDVQLLTEEEAVSALGGTGSQNLVTIFSDNFESGNFNNPNGVGGAWTSVGSRWTIRTAAGQFYDGAHGAGAVANNTNRILQKNLTIDTTKILLLDYYCNVSSVNSYSCGMALLFGPVEYIQPLSMVNGHFQYYDTALHNLPTDTTYTANIWHHVQVYLDFPNACVSWVIDGVYKGTATLKGGDTGTVINSTIAMSSLRVYNAPTSGPTFYLDDVNVKQGSFPLIIRSRQHAERCTRQAIS